MAAQLIIANTYIPVDTENRVNLNALHRASGLGKSKQPSNWLRMDSTKDLADELSNSSDLRSLPIAKGVGRKGGTFAHELLAISYAGWISPRFQLEVNRVFIESRRPSSQPSIPNNTEPLALPTHKPSRKVTLNQLIFELANLRGISPQDVRIHYSQIFNGPAWETDEFTLALACVKLRNDIAEELKQTQPEMKHLNELAVEQGMRLVSEGEYNFMKHQLNQQQAAIDELHQSIIKLSRQNQQMLSDSFWG